MMLPFVTRLRYEHERVLRLTAEARTAVVEAALLDLRLQLRQNLEIIDRQAERFKEMQFDLLDRLEPKPESKTAPVSIANADLKKLTADEILRLPAHSRREMNVRHREYQEARRRELDEERANRSSVSAAAAPPPDDASLKVAEERRLSEIVTGFITPTPLRTDAPTN